jgi:predicted Zn finger-like uncharacterized protein
VEQGVKFLCDRCQTRYSIGDDRVRGKILKIRCKNCANVITVREGMDADASAAAPEPAGRSKKSTTAAPAPLPDDPPSRARVAIPRVAQAHSEASPGNAAPAVRAIAAKDPAPAARPNAREMTKQPVARDPGKRAGADGNRAGGKRAGSPIDARSEEMGSGGPDGLAGGARGKAPRGIDARSEEMGSGGPDGLAGGARGKAPRGIDRAESSAELGAAYASSIAKPPPALEEEWYVSIDGDQAGPFSLSEAQRWVAEKAYDAELHCWSEGFDDWLPVDKVSHFRGLRKRPVPSPPLPRINSAARAAAAIAPTVPMSPVAPALPSRSAPQPSASPLDDPQPLFSATRAQLERGSASPAAQLPPAGKPARATPPLGTPVPPRTRTNGTSAPRGTPLGAPFDTSDDSDVDSELEATKYRDPRDAPAAAAAAAADAHGDDLDIGEVSRVINIADLARSAQRAPTASGGGGSSPSARAPTGAIGRITGAMPRVAGQVPGRATGAIPSFPVPPQPGAEAPTETGSMTPMAKSHRRGLIALLSVAGVMVLGVVGAVILLVTNSDDTTGGELGRVKDFDTSRPEDPITHRPIEPGPAPVKPPTPRGPRPNPTITTPPAGSNQTAEIPGNSLRGDEVEEVARKHQDITQRCYLRSQRGADSIIVGDVKKIAVTLMVDKDGNVSNMSLSEHGGDNLGKCLTTSIKSWKFRQSSTGGTFKFSLAFVSG